MGVRLHCFVAHGVGRRAVDESEGYEREMQTLDGEEYYTGAEACAILGVKPATLYAYVSRGRLHSYRQGIRRHRLYRRAEVDALAGLSPSKDAGPPPAESWVETH